MNPELLADARAAHAETMLTDVCIVVSPGATTPNGIGGRTRGPSSSRTYPCRLQSYTPFASPEQVRGGQISGQDIYTLLLPWDAVVSPESRVEKDGQRYEVIGPIDQRTERISVQVTVARIRE